MLPLEDSYFGSWRCIEEVGGGIFSPCLIGISGAAFRKVPPEKDSPQQKVVLGDRVLVLDEDAALSI